MAVSGHEDGDRLLYQGFDFVLGDHILDVQEAAPENVFTIFC